MQMLELQFEQFKVKVTSFHNQIHIYSSILTNYLFEVLKKAN